MRADRIVWHPRRSLGPLNYMRVWHDNSGSGNTASWFLKYIVVRDLQTMEKDHFICQKWLAVEKDDGVVRLAEGVVRCVQHPQTLPLG